LQEKYERLGMQTSHSRAELLQNGSKQKPSFKEQEQVLIVAGGADPTMQNGIGAYKECLFEALEGFQGTLISGGTQTGVPGMIGEYSKRCKEAGNKSFVTVSYLPQYLPSDAQKDDRYDECYPLHCGRGFSAGEPLQNWIDLVAAGIKPSKVKVLGINGGRIAALEYRLALALGAQVGVVTASGRAVDELRPDVDWYNARNLLWLPRDKMTVRAFVHAIQTPPCSEEIKALGKAIHEKFLQEKRYPADDDAMKPWEQLGKTFKDSNLMQAAYLKQALVRNHYALLPAPQPQTVEMFSPAEVETMAEMEHGRWVVERLAEGWKYGPERDTVKMISPYLVPWKDLPLKSQEYDRNAVRSWPTLLANTGLAIVPAPEPAVVG